MWQKIALCIDTFSLALGKLVAWLTLAMMLATSAVVILRYGLETGSVMLQESVFFMHAVVFMLGAAYTLQKDGHVRVDIFYQRLGPKGRSAIDLFGTLFLLLPFCVFMFWVSFP